MPIQNNAGLWSWGSVTHPQQLCDAGKGDGVYKFNTPDGGLQDGYFLRTSGTGQGCPDANTDIGWVMVGRYNADASQTITTNMSSVRGLSDATQTGGGNYWSADWGTFKAREFRIIGHTHTAANASLDIMGHRTIDWIYQLVPKTDTEGLYLWQWIGNWQWNWAGGDNRGALTDNGHVQMTTSDVQGGKQGLICHGARDGRGRWTNSSFKSIRISDASGGNKYKPMGLTRPESSMWYYHAAQDAKWAVSATDSEAGQDTDSSAMFGWDDGHRSFYDANTGNVSQNSTDLEYSSCVLMFAR